jgi:Ca2+/Na+ antiporter
MVSFFASIFWIGVFAMGMVSFATWIGCLLNISPIVLGVTLLAVGTSVPDAIGSIIASREGMGGMACSNAIGSNVFDICFGLGIPWAIKTICVRPGGFMKVKSNDLWEPISILFGTVIIVIIVFIISKFRLTKCMGATFVFLYIVYVVYQLWEGIVEALP